MNPLRTYAVILTIATLTGFTPIAGAFVAEYPTLRHVKPRVAFLQQHNAISDFWSISSTLNSTEYK